MAGYNLGTARGNIDIDTGGLQGAEVGLRQTGYALTAAGGAMVGAVGYVIKTAADFETSMSAVSAITGETGENLDKLREKALELGKQGPYGPKEVAAAFIELSKAGLTTQEILEGVGEATINLAAAGDLELARAGEILSNTMRTFQLEAADAAHIANVLAGAANASTIDVEDLAVSLKYAGSVASAVGVSFEDTANALVILGNAGIKGSTGGTSLRRILLNLNPASKAAQKEMEKLGIITKDGANQFFTAEGKAKSLGEVFDILRNSMVGMTDAQKIAAINTIFGARASASALILMREGSEGLAKANELVNRVTAEGVAEKRLDNLTGSITKLKAALEAVFIEAGTPFQGFLKGIVDGIREVVLFFGNLPQGVQTAILVIIGLIGVFTLLSGAAFLVLAPMLQLIRLFAVLPESLALVRGALAGVTAAARGFTLSLAVNPIFLIVAAIAALAAALVFLYFKWEPFREFIDGLWQSIQRIWDGVLDFFENLPARLSSAFSAIRQELEPVFNWLKDNWQDVMLALVMPQVGIPKLVMENWDSIKPAVDTATEAVTTFATETVPKVGKAVTTMAADTKTGFDQVATEAAVGGARVQQEVENTGTALNIGWGVKLGEMKATWDNMWSFLPGTIGYIMGLNIGETLRGMGVIVDLMAMKAQEAIAGAMNWIRTLPGELNTVMSFAWNIVSNNWQLIASTAWNWAYQTYLNIMNWFIQLPGAIGNFMWQMVQSIWGAVGPAVSAAWNFGWGITRSIMDAIYRLPETILNVLKEVIGTIGRMAAGAARAAFDFANGIWQGIKDGLGIHSPSYVEEAFWAMEGNVGASVGNLVKEAAKLRALRTLQGTLSVESLPSSVTAPLPDSSQANSQAGPGMIVQGPLVSLEGAVIRSQEDIVDLSRNLAAQIRNEQRAAGRKVLI